MRRDRSLRCLPWMHKLISDLAAFTCYYVHFLIRQPEWTRLTENLTHAYRNWSMIFVSFSIKIYSDGSYCLPHPPVVRTREMVGLPCTLLAKLCIWKNLVVICPKFWQKLKRAEETAQPKMLMTWTWEAALQDYWPTHLNDFNTSYCVILSNHSPETYNGKSADCRLENILVISVLIHIPREEWYPREIIYYIFPLKHLLWSTWYITVT